MMTVLRAARRHGGLSSSLWFVYTRRHRHHGRVHLRAGARPLGAHYLKVFRFAGATAFYGYALALLQDVDLVQEVLGDDARNVLIDGLIYALLTAGFFGWLWPR